MPPSKKEKIARQNTIKSRGRNPPSDRSQKRRSSDGGNANVGARGERANALVSRDSSSPTVGKPPGLGEKDTSRDVNKTQLKPDKDAKPRYDQGKGRMLYPVTQGGVTKYFPIERDASDAEKDSGAFLKDDAICARSQSINWLNQGRLSLKLSEILLRDELYLPRQLWIKTGKLW